MEQRVRPRDTVARRPRRARPLRAGHTIEANRVLDVLERLNTEIFECEIELLVDLLVDGFGNADAARRGDRLQSRRDIHTVAVDAGVLHDHSAEMDADPGLDSLARCRRRVDGGLRLLNLVCTSHGGETTVELPDTAVAGRGE